MLFVYDFIKNALFHIKKCLHLLQATIYINANSQQHGRAELQVIFKAGDEFH